MSSTAINVEPPQDDGGSPILGYVLNGGPGGPTGPSLPADGILRVDNLSPSTKYSFQVAAVTAVGQGALSQIARVVTADLPATVVEVQFGVSIGERSGGSTVTVTGNGLQSGSQVGVTMHSTPIKLGSVTADSAGAFTTDVKLPAKFDAGLHRLIIDGTSASGKSLSQTWWFSVDRADVLLNVSKGPSATPPHWKVALGAGSGAGSGAPATGEDGLPETGSTSIGGTVFTTYNPTRHPDAAQSTAVGAAALLGAVGAGAAAAGGGGSGSEGGSGPKDGDVRDAQELKHLAVLGVDHDGKIPLFWRIPGTAAFLTAMKSFPSKASQYSPVLSRISSDGGYLRALFGILSMILPLLGVALGIGAVLSVHGAPLPPPVLLMAVIMVVGIVDALAGLLAATTYVTGVAVMGGWSTLAGFRMSMTVATAFVLLIVAVSYIRPLRRPPLRSFAQVVDRIGDIIIAALMAAFVGSKLIGAIPAFAGAYLPIANSVLPIAITAGVAVSLRYLAETFVVEFMPGRMDLVHGGVPSTPSNRQRAIVLVAKCIGFGIFFSALVGTTWALWMAVALTFLVALAEGFKNLFPSIPKIRRFTLNGWFKLAISILLGYLLATIIRGNVHGALSIILITNVVLMVPAAIFEIIKASGRDGKGYTTTWPMRIAAVPFLAFTACVVLGVVEISF